MDFTNCDSDTRNVSTFTAIDSRIPFDVIMEQTDKQYVIVEGDEEHLDKIQTEVSQSKLLISLEPGRYRNIRLRVRVGITDISELVLHGSGDFFCNTAINTPHDLKIQLHGSGDMKIEDLTCSHLDASVKGSGDININDIVCDGMNASVSGSGGIATHTVNSSDDMSIAVSGSGDYSSVEVETTGCDIKVSGSGDVSITKSNIEDELYVQVSGSGAIYMNGSANSINARVSGSGDIRGRMKYNTINKSRSGSGSIQW